MHGLVYEYQVDPARVARFEEMHTLTVSGRGSEASPAIWGPSCSVTPRDLVATW
jgi:hypothetical protein